MRLTLIGLLVLGVAAALSAAILLAVLRAQQQPETIIVEAEGAAFEKIAVAARDLSEMHPVSADDLVMREMPADEIPRGALRSPQAVIGRVLARPVMEEQAFTRGAFVREGSGVHMATSLADGKRAMSIELASDSRLGSLLYPGSMVDVIASFRAPTSEDEADARGRVISTVLLEAIQVLAIDDWSVVSGDDQEEEGTQRAARRRIVTLLVDPRQAEALQLAAAHGSIALTLRNPLDRSPTRERGTRLVDLSPFFADTFVAMGEIPSLPTPMPDVVSNDAAPDEGQPVEEPDEEPRAETREPQPMPAARRESPQWRVTIIRGPGSQDSKAFQLESNQPK